MIANFLVFSRSLLTVIFFGLFSLRVIRTKQLNLLVSCFFCFFFSLLAFQLFANQQTKQLANLKEEQLQRRIRVDPNTIQVDGDLIQFEGVDSQTNEIYALSYRAKSEQEKVAYQELTSFIQLTGTLELKRPQRQRNLNGFDYQQFLKEKQIYRVGELKDVLTNQKVRVRNPVDLIKVLRRKTAVHIEQHFAPLTASYMKSLLLGVKDAAFKNQQNQFGKLGILHFFSISGMHLFFFVGTFRYLILRVGVTKRLAFYCELVFLFVFLFMTGFSTSVGRSVIFISLVSINRQFNQHFSELDCWSLTLLISLLRNPYLLFQAAGQLSFGLTFYIIYLKPIVFKRYAGTRATFLFSLCLSIFAVPLICYHFYEWHLLSLVLTLVLMPLFSLLILPLLTVTLVLSLLVPLTGWPLVLETLFSLFQQALLGASRWQFGQIVTGKIPIVIYLVCIGLTLVWLMKQQLSTKRRVFILLALLLIPSSVKWLNPKGLVAFVDVGQGDCFLLQLPFNRAAILVDTGGRIEYERSDWQKRQRESSVASQQLLPLLKSRGIDALSHVFITHGHEDHYGDLLEISRAVTVKEIIYPVGTEGQPKFKATIEQFEQTNTTLSPILSGEQWQFRDVKLQTLYPTQPGTGENDDSLVLRALIKDRSFLLTGDLEQAGEAAMAELYPDLPTSVLNAGHHGSRTSSTTVFLEAVKPDLVVISAGLNNRFGHPHDEALARLAVHTDAIYRTDQHGMVYFEWHYWGRRLSEVQQTN